MFFKAKKRIQMIIEKKQMEIMDEFSKWIKDEKYKLSEHTGLWGKYLFAEEKTVKFSELYQMFLETKKHEER